MSLESEEHQPSMFDVHPRDTRRRVTPTQSEFEYEHVNEFGEDNEYESVASVPVLENVNTFPVANPISVLESTDPSPVRNTRGAIRTIGTRSKYP